MLARSAGETVSSVGLTAAEPNADALTDRFDDHDDVRILDVNRGWTSDPVDLRRMALKDSCPPNTAETRCQRMRHYDCKGEH